MNCDFGPTLQGTRIKVSVAVTEKATTKLHVLCRYLGYH